MPYDTSPNMSLPIPVAGTTPGPDYATVGLNASLTIIDGHDHTAGSGVPITPSAMSINADLPFGNNNALSLKSARFTSQSSPLAGVSDLDCVYVSGVDLYYNDGNGNQIRITQAGSIAGVSGSIANLVSPASVTYVSGTPAFVFQSAASTSANLDAGALVLRNNTASSSGITLTPPVGLSGNYTLTLPAAPPASTKFMTMNNSGNVGITYDVDNVTLEVSSNNLQVKDAGISTVKIADSAVTTAKIADLNVTRPKLVAVGQQSSAAFVTFTSTSTSFVAATGLTATITTTGRPIIISLETDGNPGFMYVTQVYAGSGNYNFVGEVNFFNSTSSTSLYTQRFGAGGVYMDVTNASQTHYAPAGSFTTAPIAIAAGTYTFTGRVRVAGTGGATVGVNNLKLSVREL
jgi:hypothetical protein